MNRSIQICFIVTICLIPGVYLMFNYTNNDELLLGIVLFLESFGLTYFMLNSHKPAVQEFLKKYI